ncbi:MAG: ribonuclease HI family protein [Gemmataceae bacterium]
MESQPEVNPTTTKTTGEWTIYTDGAARGNPGPAAYAFSMAHDGQVVMEDAGPLGTATNNVAEYMAVVKALECAALLKADHLVLYSDSELMVKQMNGQYQVKNADLRELYDQAKRLSRSFASVRFVHVPRARNKRADELCNQVLDGKYESGPRVAPPSVISPASFREEAIACLRSAAEQWARGAANAPGVEEVWEKLWEILQARGVVK